MNNYRIPQLLPDTGNSSRHAEVPRTFKRKYVDDCKLCPRRYVVAFVLFILLLIQAWMNLNILFTLVHVLISGEESAKIKYSSIAHWTLEELDNYKTGSLVAEVFAQMPGALLIFIFSTHKLLLISVTASSILHMLTPVALNHHSISLLFVLIFQCVIAAPINIAVMTIWKDWAPPAERTKLMLFSFYGIFIGSAATFMYGYFFEYITTDLSYYLSGIAGLFWTLFWLIITSETPQNDPVISEEELVYIGNNLPSDHLQKIKIKDIPWKSILLSKPVLVICLVFFKLACSLKIISISCAEFAFHLSSKYNPSIIFVPFFISFVTIIPASALLADCLIKKFSGRTWLIRKIFFCGALSLQCVCLFGTLADPDLIGTIFYMISYTIFGVSVPGFITLPMDLSPRYVSIIAGLIFTFYKLGYVCVLCFMQATYNMLHMDYVYWLFLFDGGLSMMCVILFLIWGDAEEQLWSLTLQTSRKANDYRSDPKPEAEGDLNLVT